LSNGDEMNFDPSAFVADRELLDALEERSRTIVCSEERVLFAQGEEPTGLYILRSGSATLSMITESGQPIVLTSVAAGSLLGLPGLIGDQPYSLTAVAGPGAELGFVTREDFCRLMLSDPALSLKVLGVLAAEVRSARQAISRI
jgi:CRP-like cAMP-binding protein